MKKADKSVINITIIGNNNTLNFLEGATRLLAIIFIAIPTFVVLLVILLRYPEYIPFFISIIRDLFK